MNASASVERRHAFVLSATDTQTLWRLLEEFAGKTEATALCSDDLERTFDTPDELLAYDNPVSREIVKLSLASRSSDYNTRAEVSFFSNDQPSIRLRATGAEDSVTRFKAALIDTLGGMRPWYSPVARLDFIYVVGGIFLVLIMLVQAMTGDGKPTPGLSAGKAGLVIIITLAMLAILGLMIWVLNLLRRRFFPVATFSLGQGQRRHDFDERIRWVVFVGLLVSIVGSLFAALMRA